MAEEKMVKGLRERHKRATVNAIETAAVSLALANGHTTVTVAQICERADISRGTFFNHMSTREAAIFGRPLHLLPAAEAHAVLTLSSDVPLTTALFRLIVVSIGGSEINVEVAEGRRRLAEEQPDTQAHVLMPLVVLSTEVTQFFGEWLTAHPERRRAPHATPGQEATLTVSLVFAAFQALVTGVTGEGDVEAGEDEFTQVFSSLAVILGHAS